MPLCSFMTTATSTAATVTTLSTTVATLESTITTLESTITTLESTVATHTATLSCDASGGRRLETDEPAAAASAKDVVDAFLARHPDIAAKMDADFLVRFEELGQDFGLPARA